MTGAGWWSSYADLLPPWFCTYLSGEHEASRIETYETQFVPGLFQTADYARWVIGLDHHDPREIDRRVQLRLTRGERLLGASGPRITAVVSETALPRRGLTADQVRAQLDRLVELDRGSTVEISMLPAVHHGPGADEPFTVLTFPDPGSADLVYLEQPTDARYLRDAVDVTRYRELFGRLVELARPIGAVARDRS